jgi:hypothetical protein
MFGKGRGLKSVCSMLLFLLFVLSDCENFLLGVVAGLGLVGWLGGLYQFLVELVYEVFGGLDNAPVYFDGKVSQPKTMINHDHNHNIPNVKLSQKMQQLLSHAQNQTVLVKPLFKLFPVFALVLGHEEVGFGHQPECVG